MVLQQQQQQQQRQLHQPAAPQSNGFSSPQQLTSGANHSAPNGTNGSSQHQQRQYSPQANLYQQQLIKSAQQLIQPQQQQQLAASASSRQLLISGINGLGPQDQQQKSPSQQQIYTSATSRQLMQQQQQQVGPIYAPKPAYYVHQQQQQLLNGSPANDSQQLYQTRPTPAALASNGVQQQSYYGGQQHSPSMSALVFAGAQHLPQALARQPMASSLVSLSPVQQVAGPQQASQQQHFVQSWPDQTMQFQQQQAQMSLQANLWQQQQQMSDSFQQQQQQMMIQQPVLQQRRASARQATAAVQQHQSRSQLDGARFSDRDSVSTVSRAPGAGADRRSFTMRSQFTQYNGKARQSFGFVQLTGEALRRLLGLSADNFSRNADTNGRQPLLQQEAGRLQADQSGNQRGENLRLAAGEAQIGQPCKANSLVTALDSGEDYYFKRKVFKYELAIVRLVNLTLSALVLLSPLVMLLLPKMEPLFSGSPLSSLDSLIEQQQAPNVVTHGVGLSHKTAGSKLAAGQQALLQQQQQQQQQWRISECASSECDGPLVGFALRLIMLAFAHWAIFFRQPNVTLARVDFQRCLLVSGALLVTLAYWLFFVFRVFDKRHNDHELHYMTVIQFAISMLESLILLHYVALVLLELRQRRKVYCLKVVRSPDGASRYYSCGALSIQQCGQFVLEHYHQDFGLCDSYTEQLLAYESELARQQHQWRRAPTSSALSQSRRASRASSPVRDANADSEDEQRRAQGAKRRRSHHRRHRSSASASRTRSGHSEASDSEQDQQTRRPTSETDANRQRATTKRPEEKSDEERATKSGGGGGASSPPSDAPSSQNKKESSLETVRAAESGPRADLEISEQPRAVVQQQQQQQQAKQAELESVRSGRSRRSTASRPHRNHKRHHSGISGHHQQRAHSSDRAEHHERQEAPANSQPGELAADEHERKLRRRRLRLLAATEEAFAQIRQLDQATILQQQRQAESISVTVPAAAAATIKPPVGMDASQAARAMYPNIARSLQKYLRLTKQTGRHNLQSIYEHLAKCLLYKLNARTFLEKFLNLDPVWQQSETKLFAHCRLMNQDSSSSLGASYQKQLKQANSEPDINYWSLICDTLLSRQINSGTFFLLKQGQISLLVTVAKLPHLNLTEQVVDQSMHRYSLSTNVDTTSG